MKTSKFLLLAALMAVFALTPLTASAQVSLYHPDAVPVGVSLTADDTAPAILIGYRGGTTGGWVSIAANGDLTFEETNTSTVSTALECPVSGALGGIIDVSDTACDTMGEVVDIINDSGVFFAIPIGALRTDSSNDTLLTVTDQSVASPEGYAAKWDTDVVFTSTIPLLPYDLRTNITKYLNVSGSTGADLKVDPFAGYIPTFLYANFTSTYASGTSTYQIHCARDTFTPGTKNWVETVQLAATGIANGATTALKEHTVFANMGFQCPANTRMIARAVNSAAMASTLHNAYGKLFPVTPSR